jgi:peptidoglycan/LPS O-acetylase OafA/YrhL
MDRMKAWLTPQSAEWPVLALVRFLMALMVVGYHLPVVRPRGSVPVLEVYGGLGCICGFLAISGYSIAHSISTQPKHFFRRRAWRILPVYYATMLFALVPYLFAKGLPPFRYPFADFTTSEVAGSLFFLQCFVTEKIPIFGPSWTLAVEWWFYVMAPLFVRARPWMLWVLVGVSLAGERWGLARGYAIVSSQSWGIPALMLLWAWLSGFLYHRSPGWSAGLVVLIGYDAVSRFGDRSPDAYLIAAVALISVKSLPPMPRVLARLLNYLGDLSYPLYLVHVPMMAWVSRWTTWFDPYAFIGVSLGAAVLLYHLVDAPLRRRFSARAPAGAPRPEAPPARAAAG